MKKLLLLPFLLLFLQSQKPKAGIVSYVADMKKSSIEMFWKDGNGIRYGTLSNLRKQLESEGKKVQCLMNAGMFQKDFSPQGLFVENGKTRSPIDLSEASGNFYLKPNGVFYVSSAKAGIEVSTGFRQSATVRFATQSGPMLLIDGKLHPAFSKGSTNLNIRNGVGILPDGNVLFAISEEPINFYDFAMFFKNAGCKSALYLDGFVSKAYIPSKDMLGQDGNFGPMVGVISKD